MLNNILWEVDRMEVNRIPVGFGNGHDKLIWHYTSNGEYSVKSGYHLAHETTTATSLGLHGSLNRGLKKLWSLKLPKKVKIHCWRILNNALPVKTNLISRGLMVDTQCPRCGNTPENILHTFWYCTYARKVWKLTPVWHILGNLSVGSFADLFFWLADNDIHDNLDRFIMVCWSLWIQRNHLVFNGTEQRPEDVVHKAERSKEIFRATPLNPIVHIPTQPRASLWVAPQEGKFKVNFDAAVEANKNHFGIGIVGRDSYGHVLFAKGITMVGNFSPHIAEMIAIREGLLEALSHGWNSVILESNALRAVNGLNALRAVNGLNALRAVNGLIALNPFGLEENIVEDIRFIKANFPGVLVQHCFRLQNRVAHMLARSCFSSGCPVSYNDAIPLCIKDVVISDLVNI